MEVPIILIFGTYSVEKTGLLFNSSWRVNNAKHYTWWKNSLNYTYLVMGFI